MLESEFKSKGKQSKAKQQKKKAQEYPRAVADFLDMVKEAKKVTAFSIEAANEARFQVDNPGLIVRRIKALMEQLTALVALLEKGAR